MSESPSEIDGYTERLLFDLIDSLAREYGISERQVTTQRNLGDAVILQVHGDTEEFPGWGHHSVEVMEMTDLPVIGYVPQGNRLRVWTEEPSAPEWE